MDRKPIHKLFKLIANCSSRYGRYSDNVDSVDVWPEHLEASRRRQNYLDMPESGYLIEEGEPQGWSYLDNVGGYQDSAEDFADELHAVQKEKRSGENLEGYRLLQVI